MSRSVCAREKPCGNAAPGLRPRAYNKCKNSLPEVVPGTRSGRRRRRHRPVIVVVVVVITAIDARGGVMILHSVITPETCSDRDATSCFWRFIRFNCDVEDGIGVGMGDCVIYRRLMPANRVSPIPCCIEVANDLRLLIVQIKYVFVKEKSQLTPN